MIADPPPLEETDPRDPVALACLSRYYGELAARFAQGFDVSLSRDPEAADMIRPRGIFLLARIGTQPAGCAGLKGHGDWGEVKRLWVAPEARGRGLARHLMTGIETAARDMGLPVLRLDTNSTLAEAVALYRNAGWREIPRFNDDPYPDIFFEKRLQGCPGLPLPG